MKRWLAALLLVVPAAVLAQTTGRTPQTVQIIPQVSSSTPIGTYQTNVTISNDDAAGDQETIAVTLNVCPSGGCTPQTTGTVEALCQQFIDDSGVEPTTCEKMDLTPGVVYSNANGNWANDPPNYEGPYEGCKYCTESTTKNGGVFGGLNPNTGDSVTGVTAAAAGLPAAAGSAALLDISSGSVHEFRHNGGVDFSNGTFCMRKYFKFTEQTMCSKVPANGSQYNANNTWSGLPGICACYGTPTIYTTDCDAHSDCTQYGSGYCQPKCEGPPHYNSNCPRAYSYRGGSKGSFYGFHGWLSNQGTNNDVPYQDATYRDTCYINQPFLGNKTAENRCYLNGEFTNTCAGDGDCTGGATCKVRGGFGDMPYSATTEGSTITMRDCKDGWCREELCIDHNSRPAPNNNKIHFRHRIVALASGKTWTRKQYNTYQADPKDLSPNANPLAVIGGIDDDFGPAMDKAEIFPGEGIYIWGHLDAKKAVADENWWIGPASEVESAPSAGTEAKCSAQGASCLCSEPNQTATYRTITNFSPFTLSAPKGGVYGQKWDGANWPSSQFFNFEDSPGATECGGHRNPNTNDPWHTSEQPYCSPSLTPLLASTQVNGSGQSYLPAASTATSVMKYQGDGQCGYGAGDNFFDRTAGTTVCLRHYRRWNPAGPWSTGCDPEAQQKVTTIGGARVKDTAGVVQGSHFIKNQIAMDCNGAGQIKNGIDTLWTGLPSTSGQSFGLAGTMCGSNFCRIESCLDFDTNGNFTSRNRVTPVASPANPNPPAAVTHTNAGSNVNRPSHWNETGSNQGIAYLLTQYTPDMETFFLYGMGSEVGLDSNFWIGCAEEVEGPGC